MPPDRWFAVGTADVSAGDAGRRAADAALIRGAYSVLGAGVPMVGGCAGDGLKMYRTFQFHGGRVLTGSVVAAGIASTGPLGIGVQHGWRPAGEPMLVTGSSPNQVDSLDD